MRIAIGQLWQETNTFNPVPTTRRDFERFGVLRGAELVERMADTNELGGFIQSLRTWPERPEIVGLVRLPAWPAGAATADTFDWLQSEMLGALRNAVPIDALLLALHGSMTAVGTPDVEGAILAAVREVLGERVPIVATLDLHANVTEKMVRAADALVLYHTAPHIDVFETGQRGAAVLRRILISGARPMTAYQKLPLVVPAERANTADPASVSYGFRETLQKWETGANVLAAGLATVQPWLDVPEFGSAVIVVTDGDADLARRRCAEMADEVWKRRRDYLPELSAADQAVAIAHANANGLVVLSDSADATTSGAPGESTAILSELLNYDWHRPAILPFVDPETVKQAEQAGCGASLMVTLGGKRDRRFSRAIQLDVQVVRLFDARFVLSGHLARNLSIDMGRSVLLNHGGIHIVVTSESGPHFAPELFYAAGLDPFAAALLVAKSPCGFRAAYANRAARILVVRAPGCAPSDFWRYEYRNIQRPLWPWDEIEGWRAAPILVTRGRNGAGH
jgi:microcystin degradation protein MlrC